MLLLGYGDGLYLSELDLWATERVSAEEAEPFNVRGLPSVAARVDGNARLFFDLEEAIREMSCESRIVVWQLAPSGRKYELVATLDAAD